MASGVPVINDVIQWHFGCHYDRTLLEIVLKFAGCHEDYVGYLFIVRVSGFARYEDLRYIVKWFLGGEFMSLLPSLDDQDGTDYLVSCRNV